MLALQQHRLRRRELELEAKAGGLAGSARAIAAALGAAARSSASRAARSAVSAVAAAAMPKPLRAIRWSWQQPTALEVGDGGVREHAAARARNALASAPAMPVARAKEGDLEAPGPRRRCERAGDVPPLGARFADARRSRAGSASARCAVRGRGRQRRRRALLRAGPARDASARSIGRGSHRRSRRRRRPSMPDASGEGRLKGHRLCTSLARTQRVARRPIANTRRIRCARELVPLLAAAAARHHARRLRNDGREERHDLLRLEHRRRQGRRPRRPGRRRRALQPARQPRPARPARLARLPQHGARSAARPASTPATASARDRGATPRAWSWRRT